MRSKTALKILSETPREIKQKVKQYSDKIANKNKSNNKYP